MSDASGRYRLKATIQVTLKIGVIQLYACVKCLFMGKFEPVSVNKDSMSNYFYELAIFWNWPAIDLDL